MDASLQQSAKLIKLTEARQRLRISKPLVNALFYSGLLGDTPGERIYEHAVSSYLRYGTQWDAGERMMLDDVYDTMPPIEGIGPQPPATQTHMQAGHTDVSEEALDSDDRWMAHFYLIPNYFYFPHPLELSLVGPPPLKLSAPKKVRDAALPTMLYPHPSGYLGLVAVEGRGNPNESAELLAYDVAIPILDELSVRYDVPLPVAQSMVVGIPSGVINTYFGHRSKAKEIERSAEVLPMCPHGELRDAYALYREAVSSSNPFHSFLTFWKVYEEAMHVRRMWGMEHKRSDTKVKEERFPESWVFRGPPGDPSKDLRGRKFGRAREFLNEPYRVALAHAGKVAAGKPLTGAFSEDYKKVSTKIPIVRYMAAVVLENLRATFDDQGGLGKGAVAIQPEE